ncbi:hypothetical protein M427DRAFT_410475 [Gonapodya prolifera JEL478]|uniref:Carboxymuconolactone decarboxylase-like domain-containing protein n=1 Tax=Gonapodya prolifera (strain JEL478) TaxID=1344416 RepID=A0A139A5K4_GONPJ|nr:hypothetical protein M427DRAFT_410475 [Gonapodya prolifera JEL478]|eukprot:KXS12097.1 hypothetical protein M427DRAFT_410475 [Gonapodya prolifera JEL478]
MAPKYTPPTAKELAEYNTAFYALLHETAKRDGNLVGRIPLVTKQDADPLQRKLLENTEADGRPVGVGPTTMFMQNLELSNLFSQVLHYINLKSTLAARHKEIAILLTARFWSSDFEWYAHAPAARLAGVSEAAIEAIRQGRTPPAGSLRDDERPLYELVWQLLNNKRVDDATFKQCMEVYGSVTLFETIVITAYYCMVSLCLNLDELPLPPGAKDTLPKL